MAAYLVVNERSWYWDDSEAGLILQINAFAMAIRAFAKAHPAIRFSSACYVGELLLLGARLVAHIGRAGITHDLRILLLTLLAKQELLPPECIDFAQEFVLGPSACPSLGAAWILDTLAISLNNAAPFDSSTVVIERRSIDADGEMNTEDVEVQHASDESHVDEYLAGAASRAAPPTSGPELVANWTIYFPGVMLGQGAERQLVALGVGDQMLGSVYRVLRRVSKSVVFANAQGVPATSLIPNLRPETAMTLARYPGSRTFADHAGQALEFSAHGSIAPNNWRYYLADIMGGTQVVIGYVGPKLPTTRFPKP